MFYKDILKHTNLIDYMPYKPTFPPNAISNLPIIIVTAINPQWKCSNPKILYDEHVKNPTFSPKVNSLTLSTHQITLQ